MEKKTLRQESKLENRQDLDFNFGDTALHVSITEDDHTAYRLRVDKFLLENKKGETFDLLGLLPPNWKFVLDGGLIASATFGEVKTIALHAKRMQRTSYTVGPGENLPEEKFEIRKRDTPLGPDSYQREVDKENRTVYESETVPIFFGNPEAVFVFLHELGHATLENELTFEEKSLERVKEERAAWAFAVKQIRTLKRLGFSFGKDFDSSKNIKKMFSYPLHTYGDPKNKMD